MLERTANADADVQSRCDRPPGEPHLVLARKPSSVRDVASCRDRCTPERRYQRQLATLVRDMGVEQQQLEAYRPLDEPVLDEPVRSALSESSFKEKA